MAYLVGGYPACEVSLARAPTRKKRAALRSCRLLPRAATRFLQGGGGVSGLHGAAGSAKEAAGGTVNSDKRGRGLANFHKVDRFSSFARRDAAFGMHDRRQPDDRS